MRRRLNAEHIRTLLQQVKADRQMGLSWADCARKLGVCQMTLRRWRARIEKAGAEPVGRVGDLETEVARLKRLVAELLLEKQMLQDLAQKKW
jgi:putative transposase